MRTGGNMHSQLIAGLLALASLSVYAEPNDAIRIGMPSYGGSGCPAGTASLTLSPSGESAAVLLDEFSLEMGGAGTPLMDRKSCDLAIPIHVPEGYSVALNQAAYVGYLDLPRGGNARLSIEHFFAGARGPRLATTFQGPKNQEFTLVGPPSGAATVWSSCGQDVILRVNASLIVETNAAREKAKAAIERLTFERLIKWRKCNVAPPAPTPDPAPTPPANT